MEGIAGAQDFAGGEGTEDSPYLIETAQQLDMVRNYLDAHFEQISDIDLKPYLDDEGWEPVGAFRDVFTGSFNGNGYIIENLRIDRPGLSYNGLIARVGSGSRLENIELRNVHISGGEWNVGALTASNAGTIENCHVTGQISESERVVGGLVGINRKEGAIRRSSAEVNITLEEHTGGGLVGLNEGILSYCKAHPMLKGGMNVGGLAGINRRSVDDQTHDNGTIIGSYTEGNVEGEKTLGGLVGRNWNGIITESFSLVNVSAIEGEVHAVGGLVGLSHAEGNISNTFSAGEVTGHNSVGGLVGYNDENSIIRKSYARGLVTGDEYVGGLIGNNFGEVENSYYDKQTTGQEDENKGIPLLTEEMKSPDSYEEWDFQDTWRLVEGDYPVLLIEENFSY